jgi:hypothetical protein
MITIKRRDGTIRNIRIDFFKALDGWNISQEFLTFAASLDKEYRKQFTLGILKYATLINDGGVELPLITEALIDNHLQSWENVQIVFEAVLLENGIDAQTHADKPAFWHNAGAEMAVSFIAEASKLFGPAMKILEERMLEDEAAEKE